MTPLSASDTTEFLRLSHLIAAADRATLRRRVNLLTPEFPQFKPPNEEFDAGFRQACRRVMEMLEERS